MDDVNIETGPAKAVSHLGECLSQTAESQRALFQEMSNFAKDESQRFFSTRLERNGAAMDRMQNCQGIAGLMGAQQEWLRDLLHDYTAQQMRFANAFRGLAHNVVTSATQAASENIDRMQKHAAGMAHQAEDMAHHAADMTQHAMDSAYNTAEHTNPLAQDTPDYVPGTQH
ncbi:MAG TPA: hypothetical protein VGM26_11470 [Rhizomicrobium sp.]|jgi:hypothetical protein